MPKPPIRSNPVLKIQTTITDRDYRLLDWLYDHGVLTTDQIAKALFPSLDFAQRRLLRLARVNLIDRFRPNKPDGGSFPYHYVLAQLGYEHVMGQRDLGLPRRDQARRRQQSLIARHDLAHLLGSNGLFIDLAYHERTHPGTRLLQWQPASAFHEPGAFYREGSNPSMMTKIKGLPRPDAAGIWAQDGRTVPFFAEYDTGTERLDVLTDKVAKYGLLSVYAHTWAWPVIFLLPTVRREHNWLDRLATAYGTPPIVIATAASDYLAGTGKTAADDVWHLVGSGEGRRRRLIDLPYHDPEHNQEGR